MPWCLQAFRFSFRLWLLALLTACMPVHALIVFEGKIVPEWPAESGAAPLGKPGSKVAAASFYPSPKGAIWGLTMLVDFPDQAPAFNLAEVKDWLNLKGFNRSGCNGSVRDYYLDVSNGKLDFQNEVYGYYRAKQPKTYYDGGTGYERAAELINEMIAHFDPLVDFSNFDNDKDGKTEAISIVYAGVGAAWGKGLWPHAGGINKTLDGVTVNRYMMTDLGTEFGLYVFAHECGHMIFGWPDLYYFGDYCLMGNRPNDANPVAINDFYRADQGWIPTVDVDRNTNSYYKAAFGESGYRYINPAKPTEMFYWSNLKNTNRWGVLAGKGLLVYHFDKSRGANSSGSSRSLFVVEADGANNMAGSQWPNPGSSAFDFFSQSVKSELAQTNAGSRWNDGTASGLRIYNIGPMADEMTFAVGTGVAVGIARPGWTGLLLLKAKAGGLYFDARGAVRPGWIPGRILASRLGF